tara:strand:- start:9019 stop:9693 length:675 start_codon:yes stop_codon:yes gene_type:complete
MAKYFRFLSPDGSQQQVLDMDNVKYIWGETTSKIVFVSKDFTETGEVCYTLDKSDDRQEILAYLQSQWQSLILGNDTFIDIPYTLPFTKSVECTANTWAEWEVMVGFDPTNCNVILAATISPEGLGTITIGDSFVNPVTGSPANWYATATGTPCGTQDLIFLGGIECGEVGTPVFIPGFEEYYFTGFATSCEGDEPLDYCLAAKKVFTNETYRGTLAMNKVTVP